MFLLFEEKMCLEKKARIENYGENFSWQTKVLERLGAFHQEEEFARYYLIEVWQDSNLENETKISLRKV